MKNIALFFERAREHDGGAATTNATALANLLSRNDGQLVWAPRPAERNRFGLGRARLESARAAVAEAYAFLAEEWRPGDRLFLFGAGRGAACARALARLLGTVGLLVEDLPGWSAEDFRDYVLSTYDLPRTRRDDTDWRDIGRLTEHLAGRADIAVEVHFLGLWDTVAVPGAARTDAVETLANVVAGRHAIAIDGCHRPGAQLRGRSEEAVQEVWFRGAHCDVVGADKGCVSLSGIALDWVVDGAVRAGAVMRHYQASHAPNSVDALAGGAHPVSFPAPLRHVCADAQVHASVESYLRVHPSYWRRLPAHVVWADPDWAARAERLMAVPTTPRVVGTPTLVAAS